MRRATGKRLKAMKAMKAVTAGLLLAAIGAGDALASGGRVWQIQETGIGGGSDFTGAAMRSNAWPVIISGSGDVIGLRATEGPFNSNWHEDGFFNMSGPVTAKTSSEGRFVAFTPLTPTDESVLGGINGSLTTINDIRAAAFTPDGALVTVDPANFVSGYGDPGVGGVIDIAVAPDGTLGAVTTSGEYVEHRFGSWGNPVDLQLATGVAINNARLAFDAQSVPHIVGTNGPMLYAADFSTISGTWASTLLGESGGAAAAVASTYLNAGEVGAAFYDPALNEVRYSYRSGSSGWTTMTVPNPNPGPSLPIQTPGVAFDYEGLPVVSFFNGEYIFAYDPIEVAPEPTSAALMGLAGLMVMRRRRGA